MLVVVHFSSSEQFASDDDRTEQELCSKQIRRILKPFQRYYSTLLLAINYINFREWNRSNEHIYIYNVEGQLVEYFQPIFPLRSSNKLKRDNETIYRFRAGIVRARHAISPSRTFRFVEATVVNSFSFLNSSLEFCPDNITSDQFVLIVRYAGHVYAKNSVQPL